MGRSTDKKSNRFYDDYADNGKSLNGAKFDEPRYYERADRASSPLRGSQNFASMLNKFKVDLDGDKERNRNQRTEYYEQDYEKYRDRQEDRRSMPTS